MLPPRVSPFSKVKCSIFSACPIKEMATIRASSALVKTVDAGSFVPMGTSFLVQRQKRLKNAQPQNEILCSEGAWGVVLNKQTAGNVSVY